MHRVDGDGQQPPWFRWGCSMHFHSLGCVSLHYWRHKFAFDCARRFSFSFAGHWLNALSPEPASRGSCQRVCALTISNAGLPSLRATDFLCQRPARCFVIAMWQQLAPMQKLSGCAAASRQCQQYRNCCRIGRVFWPFEHESCLEISFNFIHWQRKRHY